jgi:hypothetical protein
VTSPDDEMSAPDRNLMRALAEAIGGQRPPIDLVARCEALLSWIDVDSELAILLDQPVAEAAGTRGATSSALTFEFAIADGSCVIEVTLPDGGLRGQLLGGETQHVIVRTAAGVTHSLPVDEFGNFSLDNPTLGAIRLELELLGASRRIHTDWFVI